MNNKVAPAGFATEDATQPPSQVRQTAIEASFHSVTDTITTFLLADEFQEPAGYCCVSEDQVPTFGDRCEKQVE
jgi:hypothetical protein